MPRLNSFSAFIFDLDGLVLDTEPTYFAAWRQAIKIMGFELDENSFSSLSGRHFSQIKEYLIDRYGSGFDVQQFAELGGMIWRQYVQENGLAIKPGVFELLDYAGRERLPVCLATNSSALYAKECLNIAEISERFPLMVSGDDVAEAKPAPDIFLKAADVMAVDIRRSLVFEDSRAGVVAAAKAGACVAYVPSIVPADPLTLTLSDYYLNDLLQAFEIIHNDQDIITG